MKEFFKKNKFVILFVFSLLLISGSIFIKVFGMETYEKTDFEYGIVNTQYLNLRSGAGINFPSNGVLTKNEYVRIFGKIKDWYIVQNEKTQIGCVHQAYIIPTDTTKAAATNSEPIEEKKGETQNYTYRENLTGDESELLTLINNERKKNNLQDLQIDSNIENLARLKAKDIVENNYFSHISPTYGTPFEMLKSNNITYKTASENIAGNSTIQGAFESWINSEDHKNNILSNTFNYTGIGIVDSIAYGKIIVEIFIGK